MRKKPEKKPDPSEVVKVPLDTTSEAVLIAAVVKDERARERYLGSITSDYFFGDGHAAMWQALREIYRQELEYSPDVAGTFANGRFKPERLDDYVKAYREAGVNVKRHAEIVRWNRQKKIAAEGSVALFLETFRDAAAEPTAVQSAARKVLQAFEGGDLRYLRRSKDVIDELMAELRERREGKALYPYGLPGFDCYGPDDFEETDSGSRVSIENKPRMVPGCAPGLITVITGESGSGKSTALDYIVRAQIERGRRVLWGSWEMGPKKSFESIGCSTQGFSKASFYTGRYSDEDLEEFEQNLRRVGEKILMFELPFGREVKDRRTFNRENLDLIHQYVAESGCDVFVADLFSDALEDSSPDEEAQALKRMKAIAEECGVHVILVHWLRHKGLAEREDKRPTRDLVMGSGAWIGKADTVIAFHRPGLHGAPSDNTIEAHVLKQRYGAWPLCVEFDWNGEFGSIERGRTAVIAAPGAKTEIDGFLDEAAPVKPKKKRYRR